MDVKSLGEAGLPLDATFILGDHVGMTPEEEGLIDQAGAGIISLGQTSLHADHCIVLLNWILDSNEALPDAASG